MTTDSLTEWTHNTGDNTYEMTTTSGRTFTVSRGPRVWTLSDTADTEAFAATTMSACKREAHRRVAQ